LDTRKLAAFVAAAQAGSLSSAAKRTGVTLSTVSRYVADLESSLGVALLVRTGRGVRATPAGERLLASARLVLRELDGVRADLDRTQPRLAQLRLSAPPDFARCVLPAVLDELGRRRPELEIDALGDTRRVSLLEEDYDAAVRIGPLDDSGLVARKLGVASRMLLAAPHAARALRSVSDLDRADKVGVTGAPAQLAATIRDRTVRLRLDARIRVGSFVEAGEIAARSARVVLLPSFAAAAFVTAGRLSPVLPSLKIAPVVLHLLVPARHRSEPLLRELGEMLTTELATIERLFASPTRATRARVHE
jgi:LysR family transcriptional regulator for bpeEF and oprC